MDLNNPGAEIYIPDGAGVAEAIARATHMGIGAHADDLPIMAFHGISECYGPSDRWFLGVTVTDGAGSPRSGAYAGHTDADMRRVRAREEKAAARMGRYAATVLLDYASPAARTLSEEGLVRDIVGLVESAQPQIIYTHSLADRHPTHVAVALQTISALRSLAPEGRPKAVYGCELWRDLDWLTEQDRVVLDVSPHQKLAASLIELYDSQLSGGKRYDLAVAGRRRAHATFRDFQAVDDASALIYASDLTPLVTDPSLDPGAFVQAQIDRMSLDVADRIAKMTKSK